jgi:hypothetical protein
MRDPVRFDRDGYWKLRAERDAGQRVGETGVPRYPLASIGRTGLDQLEWGLDLVRVESVPGDLVEAGTGRGGAGVFMRSYLETVDDWPVTLFVADRFDPSRATTVMDQGPDLNTVRDGFEWFGLLDERVRFLVGAPGTVLSDPEVGDIALARIGRDLGPDVVDALSGLYPQVSDGGLVIVENLDDPETADAVATLRQRAGETEPLTRVGLSGGWWRKRPGGVGGGPTTRARHQPRAGGAPLVAATDQTETLDLSVVVVAYNMRRAAERTLRSLSRSYQVDVEHLDYEVVVVENGSDPSQRLGEPLVRSFGPEFRYLDLGADAKPSPVTALNRGLESGRGDAFALMIDGAHLLTPGVLHYGMRGLREAPSAITAMRHWYLGPGQQVDTVGVGYDEQYEDELLEAVHWPANGYGLFDVGQFIGERDWLDELFESNCLFVGRDLLARYGGFDESFAVPGGGFANLDIFERLASAADVTTVTVIGEASFHQVHGGVTTNVGHPERSVRQDPGCARGLEARPAADRSFPPAGGERNSTGSRLKRGSDS